MDLEWATGEMSHLKTFLLEQIKRKEIELVESENILKQFQEKEQVFGVDNKSNLLLENLLNTESKLYNSIAEQNILTERKKYIQKQLTSEEKKLVQSVSNTINDRLFALRNEISIKESELISAISQQGEEHEVVIKIQKKTTMIVMQLLKDKYLFFLSLFHFWPCLLNQQR